MKILVTGFDPFGGESTNPSFEAVKLLPEEIADAEIIKQELPTVFGTSGEVLKKAIENVQPDLVICTGQAGGAKGIRLERVAVNLMDARIPDNAGNQPLEEPVVEGGPVGYFSTLPLTKIREALTAAELPVENSLSAGAYVCNFIFYTLRNYIETKMENKIPGGFIHVPFIPEQVENKPGMPSMPLTEIAKGLEIAIRTTVENM